MSAKRFARGFGSVLVAVLGRRAIFDAFEFRYRIFSDPFDPVKLAVDFGVLVGLFYIARWLFDRLLQSRPGDEP